MSNPSESNVSRWIAFLVGPLVILLSGFVSLKAKQWFGIEVSSGAVEAYTLGIVLSIGGLFAVWLHNRGKNEIAKLTGLSPEKVEELIDLVEERLPDAPSSPKSGSAGAPSQPRAPGRHKT